MIKLGLSEYVFCDHFGFVYAFALEECIVLLPLKRSGQRPWNIFIAARFNFCFISISSSTCSAHVKPSARTIGSAPPGTSSSLPASISASFPSPPPRARPSDRTIGSAPLEHLHRCPLQFLLHLHLLLHVLGPALERSGQAPWNIFIAARFNFASSPRWNDQAISNIVLAAGCLFQRAVNISKHVGRDQTHLVNQQHIPSTHEASLVALPVIAARTYKHLFTVVHSCSRLFTVVHGCSLLFTVVHGCSHPKPVRIHVVGAVG